MSTLLEYKCPNCGGAVTFDSGAQKMACPYCDAQFEPETFKEYIEEMSAGYEDNYGWGAYAAQELTEGEGGMAAYSCPACGGEILGDANTAATSCPFCGNAAIIASKLSGVLKPDYVIPFIMDKEAAKKALSAHLKGKLLLPKLFKEENRINSITGIYAPFWLFGCDARARIRYRATKVHRWSDSRYDYTKTDYYTLVREGGIGFERVPADASKKLDDAFMDAIEPYDFNKLIPFGTAYLSGYLADKYDVGADESKERANRRIKNSVERVFSETAAGYTTCTPENTNIAFENGTVNYALLPVWILNTTYKGKSYGFAMNGQTGKLIGELPVSWGRFFAWLFGITFVLTAVFAAVAYAALR